MSNCAFVQMSPFYPIKAKEKGVSQIYVGFIFGVMALCQILSSLLVGQFLHTFNIERHQLITMGSALIIFQTGVLGMLEHIDSVNAFITISFVAQVLGGIGAGSNSTASMAIMSSFSKAEREKYLGLI